MLPENVKRALTKKNDKHLNEICMQSGVTSVKLHSHCVRARFPQRDHGRKPCQATTRKPCRQKLLPVAVCGTARACMHRGRHILPRLSPRAHGTFHEQVQSASFTIFAWPSESHCDNKDQCTHSRHCCCNLILLHKVDSMSMIRTHKWS